MGSGKRQRKPAPRESIKLGMFPHDRDIIDRAASVAGKTRAEFMIEASVVAAHETLLDANIVVVDGPTFRRFKKLLDAPARPNACLRRLMNLKPPWEL